MSVSGTAAAILLQHNGRLQEREKTEVLAAFAAEGEVTVGYVEVSKRGLMAASALQTRNSGAKE